MRLVILEAESLGKDMDLSGFSRFGEVTVYEKTCDILDDMSQKGFIDSDISKTIRECFGRI